MAEPAQRWSLVRRLTGGVVLIALLSFAAQAVVLALWLRPVAAEVAVNIAEQAVQVRTALQAVPPAQRPALAAQLSSGWLTVSRQQPAEAPAPGLDPPPEFDTVVQVLQGQGIDMRVQSKAARSALAGSGGLSGLSGLNDERGVDFVFRLPLDTEVWWLARTVIRPSSALSGTLLVWLAVLALATAGALWVSVRLIARPIGRLAEQIAAQQGALRPLPLDSDGSAELAAVVHAFNELAHQVMAAANARQQLLAGVSHDLRTPLARLRLRAETQCEPALADALTDDLLALERIVNQFLAYVQFDAQDDLPGGAGPSGAALGLPAPLEDSVRDTVQRYAAAGQGLGLHIDPMAQLAPDVAVQRLLSNLIDNACAYGQGPVRVELRALAGGAELCVSDHGPGMSEEEFQRAQLPFVRLTRARSGLGHCGLGLAIVAQIARQLGGRLRLVRGEGRGFGIALWLPAGGG